MSGRAYGDELYRPALTGALDEKDFWQWWRENYMGWLRFREGEERRGTLRGWQAFVQDTQGFAQLHEVVDRPALPAPPPELDLTDPGGPQREFAPAPSPHVEGQVDVRPHA
jgi:hypothetical protein